MGFIRIDYDKAFAQAKKLEQAADMCATALRNLKNEMGRSETAWVGESGNAMRAQLQVAERELASTGQQLTAAAASIRRIAEEFRKQDQIMENNINSFG